MNASRKITQLTLLNLIHWYKKHQRELPWRTNPNPYWVWLAEVMSQQTQMTTLLPYFYKFIEKFPSLESLAIAEINEVLKFWTGLGYYTRARNLHKAAGELLNKYHGKFPTSYADWRLLPGIGPYTAAAITSQCFQIPEPVWDGNVLRVFSRYFADKSARSDRFKTEILLKLRTLLQTNPNTLKSGNLNQAIMELGALICTVKNPKCAICPIEKNCKARSQNTISKFPPIKIKKNEIKLNPKVLVIIHKRKNEHKILLTQRKHPHWFSGMWDFPSELGGIKEPIKTLPTNVSEFESFGTAKHSITHHKILLHGYVKYENKPNSHSFSNAKWLSIDDVFSENPSLPLATTTRKLLRLLGKKMQI